MTNNKSILDKIVGSKDIRYERKKEKIKEQKEQAQKIKFQYKKLLRKMEGTTSNVSPPPQVIKKNIERKQGGFIEAQEMYKRKQEELEKQRIEKSKQQRQRKQIFHQRIEKKRKMNQKTSKGQPIMKYRMKNLLSQIKQTL